MEGQQPLLESIRKDVDEPKTRITALGQKIDRFREELSSQIIALAQRTDEKIFALDQKVDRVREELDRKMSRFFLWMLGIQFSTLLTLIGILFKISQGFFITILNF